MRLTGRQREFLRCLLALHEEEHRPLHYSAVAERLGVKPVTAYDMLRVFEARGLVSSRYVVPEGAGKGRSNIVFVPTRRAFEVLERSPDVGRDLSGTVSESTSWRLFAVAAARNVPDCWTRSFPTSAR